MAVESVAYAEKSERRRGSLARGVTVAKIREKRMTRRVGGKEGSLVGVRFPAGSGVKLGACRKTLVRLLRA